jgi:adenylate cyclase
MSNVPTQADLYTTSRRIAELIRSLDSKLDKETIDGKTSDLLLRMANSSSQLDVALSESDETREYSHEYRHLIRNHLNQISGPCQLLRRRLGTLAQEPLAEIQELVRWCADSLESVSLLSDAPVVTSSVSVKPALATYAARILVAEDDVVNRQLLADILIDEGHAVEVAGDGIAALARAENADFDLLLLDLGLPKISGFEVLERLQASGWKTPVIVVTGRSAVNDAVRCIEHGADDFLTKPIQIEILRARVNSCVEKMRLREREFGQFFPPKLARQFARRPNMVNELPSHDAEVSVLFCDIRNFTAISERLGPDITMRWLRGVMHELSELVIDNEGVLVDFAGDEIMAMWGAPEATQQHATRACNTAVQILERLPAISASWRGQIGVETDLSIGVNSGRAMVGHIGTSRKTKYGPLGDTVNVGSRILGATAHLRTRLLISGQTRAAVDEHWTNGLSRRLCQVRMKNLAQSVELFELRPVSDGVSQNDLTERYEQALAYYETHTLQQAAALLGQLLVDYPDDGPSLVLMSRVVGAMLAPDALPDPVWTLPSK